MVPMKHTVRVRALSNVLGLHYGDVVEVVATPRVEVLIRGGHLEWVDEAGVKVVETAEPVLSDASFDDELDDEPLTPAKFVPMVESEDDYVYASRDETTAAASAARKARRTRSKAADDAE